MFYFAEIPLTQLEEHIQTVVLSVARQNDSQVTVLTGWLLELSYCRQSVGSI